MQRMGRHPSHIASYIICGQQETPILYQMCEDMAVVSDVSEHPGSIGSNHTAACWNKKEWAAAQCRIVSIWETTSTTASAQLTWAAFCR
eukprot:3474492-Amphidinium_carterae.2